MLALAAATLALFPAAASAAAVTNTNDSGPGSLRKAIEDAASGETISVPAGTYTLTSGELLILNKSLTLAGAGAASTTIRTNGGSRVLLIIGSSPDQQDTVTGITIKEGHTTKSSPIGAQGAGVLAVEVNLTLRDDVITGNLADSFEAGASGGAVYGVGLLYVGESSQRATIAGTLISGNVAKADGDSGHAGGLVFGAGMLTTGGSLSLEGSAIEGNSGEARGGQGPSSVEQKGGRIEGGGLLVVGNSTPASIRTTTIAGNAGVASPGPGGSGGKVAGAGAEIVPSAPLSFAEVTVTGNQARASAGNALGGGLFLISGGPGKSISVTSSTVAANLVEGIDETGGGNVFAETPVTFADTIVSGGAGPSGSQNCEIVGTPGEATSAGFNLDSLDQCRFHGPGDIVNRDPLLGPLQANGGPTATMAPAINSPAVDQGAALGLSTDQRGLPRPIDFPSIPNSSATGADGTDIGAVELQPSTAISFGALKRNKKKGTATLTVNLPVPNVGTVSLGGNGLKARSVTLSGASSSVTLPLVATRSARKALRRHGKRKVSVSVTYAPPSTAPATITRVVKLVRKKKRHRHHKHHRHGKGHHGKSG